MSSLVLAVTGPESGITPCGCGRKEDLQDLNVNMDQNLKGTFLTSSEIHATKH